MINIVNHGSLEGPRPARINELEDILALLNHVHRVSRGREPTIASDYPHIYNDANIENVTIIKIDDKVISSAAFWPNEIQLGSVRLRVGGVNLMATLPEYRQHGLGIRVLNAVHQCMREKGCHVGLLGTQIVNWYRRHDWEQAGISRSYHFDRGNIGLLPRLPESVEMRLASEEDVEKVLSLRHADALGGIRTSAVFRQLMTARKVSSLFLAEADGRCFAYLMIKSMRVIEWGGDARILAGLLKAWYEKVNDQTISTSARDASFRPASLTGVEFLAPWTGHPIVDLLDEIRIPFGAEYVGMIHILDPNGVLDTFGYKAISVTEQGGLHTIRRDNESVTLDQRNLAKLFFGPERVSDMASNIFPLPFWQWQIEHV